MPVGIRNPASRITPSLVDEADTELDRDRSFILIRTAPCQLQAAMAALLQASRKAKGMPIGTNEAYDSCKAACARADLRPLSGRAFSDLLGELDMHSLVRCRVFSKGRYGRTREISVDLP